MKQTLPKLPYAYDALEPYIDAKTMEIHHSKHHQKYVDNTNMILDKYPILQDKDLMSLLSNLKDLKIDEKDKTFLKNNGGGVLNHSFFWEILGPKKEIDEKLLEELTAQFGSLDEFKKQFTAVANSHFGSGWAWLTKDEKGKFKVYSTPNQDLPSETPIITLDLWEHAYYLKYQNRRQEYVDNFWNVLKCI